MGFLKVVICASFLPSVGYLSDLWKFDGTNWIWIAGSKEKIQYGHYGIKGIPHVDNFFGYRENGIAWTDSSDNLYLFGGYGSSSDEILK
jgi:hypothetical protein